MPTYSKVTKPLGSTGSIGANDGRGALTLIDEAQARHKDPLGKRLPAPSSGGQLGDPNDRKRGTVILSAPNVELSVTGRIIELPQVVQERAGGWDVRRRPSQLPRTWRPGSGELLKVRLVIMFDRYSPPKESVQPEINALRRLAYRDPATRRDAVINIIGAVPYASGGLQPGYRDNPPEWVIDELSIEEELHLRNGTPCRATATIVLLEYQPGKLEIRRTEPERARKKEWRKGDTLSKFARRHGKPPELIRKANPTIKKWSDVKRGTKIKVPGVVDELQR